MDNVTISYLTYLPLSLFMVSYIGWQLHKNGRIYIKEILKQDDNFTDKLNNLLLLAYYLVNIGFAFLAIQIWPEVITIIDALVLALVQFGKLCLILGILHLNNKVCMILYALHKNYLRI